MLSRSDAPSSSHGGALRHATTIDLGETSVSQAESHEFRRQPSWQASSGRRHGGEEYRFGDVARSAFRKLGSQKDESAPARAETKVSPHQRPSVLPSKLDELTELDKLFIVAKSEISRSLKEVNDGDMLQEYALYNQSTAGPCSGERPTAANSAKKWEAWSQLGAMDREAARSAYCSLADKVAPGWRSVNVPDASVKAADASCNGSDGAECSEDGARVEGTQVVAVGANGVHVECIQVEGAQAEGVQVEGTHVDSHEFRRHETWQKSSGRLHGGAEYKFGDISRSVFRKREGARVEKAEGAQADHTAIPSTAKLDSTFATAAEAVKSLKSVSPEDQLLLYAHFKRATVGCAAGVRPGMSDPKSRVMWDAWASLNSMDVATAQKEYCCLVDRLCPGWRSAGKVELTSGQVGTSNAASIDSSNADVDALFVAAGKAVMKVPHIGNADSLAVYAYFKQATCGPLIDKRPDRHDIPACARWAAWAGLSSMDSQSAKKTYCKLVDQLAPGWRSTDTVAESAFEASSLATIDLDALFDAAAEGLKRLKSMTTSDQLLVYSYFKQAKAGMVTGSRPGMMDPKGRAKWDAWAALKAMDAGAAKTEYCAIADRLAPGWRPATATSTSEQRAVVAATSQEPLAKLKQLNSVDRSRASGDVAERVDPAPAANEGGRTTVAAQGEPVSQRIPAADLSGRCAAVALAVLACRAAFRQRSASRAAAFGLLCVCLARLKSGGPASKLLASVGITFEVDSKILRASLKDGLATLVPGRPDLPRPEKAPKTNQLAKSTERDGWTFVGSSLPETDEWSDVGPSKSERRSK